MNIEDFPEEIHGLIREFKDELLYYCPQYPMGTNRGICKRYVTFLRACATVFKDDRTPLQIVYRHLYLIKFDTNEEWFSPIGAIVNHYVEKPLSIWHWQQYDMIATSEGMDENDTDWLKRKYHRFYPKNIKTKKFAKTQLTLNQMLRSITDCNDFLRLPPPLMFHQIFNSGLSRYDVASIYAMQADNLESRWKKDVRTSTV